MQKFDQVGKLTPEDFDKYIFPFLGSKNEKVIIGPKHGVDAAVVDLGDKLMVVAEDPTYGLPTLGYKRFGWAIVHICCSDVACLGATPELMTICLLLPPETPKSALKDVMSTMDEECKKLGVSLIGGHTGVVPGISFILNGGCTVFGFTTKEKLIVPSGAKPGHKVVVTKGAAIETAPILAYQYPDGLEKAFGSDVVKKAQDMFYDMTVVKDALIAREIEGVSAMHDATEGGVLGGLYEVGNASGVGMKIHKDRIILSDEASKICEFFEIDPYFSISEGSLIITVDKNYEDELLEALWKENIEATVVGECVDESRGMTLHENDKKIGSFTFPATDPFWEAYFKAIQYSEDS
ncbi:MAG: AIR synthase family protein, partial [Candidatus Helarchaeota archaeon]